MESQQLDSTGTPSATVRYLWAVFPVTFTVPAETTAIDLAASAAPPRSVAETAANNLIHSLAGDRNSRAVVALAVLHTITQELYFHPHVHLIVPQVL